jgi:hypothetical protein
MLPTDPRTTANRARFESANNPLQEVSRILRVIESADMEFSQSLLLLVERIVLHRLTTARKQDQELVTLVSSIKKIVSSSRGAMDVPSQISKLKVSEDSSEQREQLHENGAPLTYSFREVVDAIETMNPTELFELVSRLRKEPLKRKINRSLFAD